VCARACVCACVCVPIRRVACGWVMRVCVCVCVCVCVAAYYAGETQYGVATISRLLKIIGLFCKRALQKRLYSTNISYMRHETHGVATISRLLKIIGLFCRIVSLLQGSFVKETYHLATYYAGETRGYD